MKCKCGHDSGVLNGDGRCWPNHSDCECQRFEACTHFLDATSSTAWDAARAALCVAAEHLGVADAEWRARGVRADRRKRASRALIDAQRRVLAAALALHRAGQP